MKWTPSTEHQLTLTYILTATANASIHECISSTVSHRNLHNRRSSSSDSGWNKQTHNVRWVLNPIQSSTKIYAYLQLKFKRWPVFLRNFRKYISGHTNRTILDTFRRISFEIFAALVIKHIGAFEYEVFAAPIGLGRHHPDQKNIAMRIISRQIAICHENWKQRIRTFVLTLYPPSLTSNPP